LGRRPIKSGGPLAASSRELRKSLSVLITDIIEGILMTTVVLLQPVVALIAGVLILLVPRLLSYVVALYLIVVGLIGLVQISA